MLRRSILPFGLITMLILCTAMGQPSSPNAGQQLFETHCARCHGSDGAKGKWGAKDLRTSRLGDAAIMNQVRTGRSIMPSFSKKLNEAEVAEVMRYVKELRK
ncbi:MAG: cytochrome c [Flavobacteriales bacterium]